MRELCLPCNEGHLQTNLEKITSSMSLLTFTPSVLADLMFIGLWVGPLLLLTGWASAVSFLHLIGRHRCPVSSHPILKLVICGIWQKRCTPSIILQILSDLMEQPGCDSTATGSCLRPPCQFIVSLAHPSATALPISSSVYAVHSTWG